MYLLLDAEVVGTDSFETEDGKNDDAGIDGRGGVADRQDNGVFDTIVSRRIVAAESDERSKSNVERVEDLSGGVQPDGRVQ